MIKNQEELLRILPLKNNELKLLALVEVKELLLREKYKKYDDDFKKNFAQGYVEKFIKEISSARENLAITMANESKNKVDIMKVTGLTLEELDNLKIKSNNKEILKIYNHIKYNK
ncbi:MAG: hypothetical protein ACK5LY_01195 [Lachnospirales bacterium]